MPVRANLLREGHKASRVSNMISAIAFKHLRASYMGRDKNIRVARWKWRKLRFQPHKRSKLTFFTGEISLVSSKDRTDNLSQRCGNSIATALELSQSCTTTSIHILSKKTSSYLSVPNCDLVQSQFIIGPWGPKWLPTCDERCWALPGAASYSWSFPDFFLTWETVLARYRNARKWERGEGRSSRHQLTPPGNQQPSGGNGLTWWFYTTGGLPTGGLQSRQVLGEWMITWF